MNKSYQFSWWLAIITIFLMNFMVILISTIFPGTNIYLISIYGELAILGSILLGLWYLKKNDISHTETLAIKPFSPYLLFIFPIITMGIQYFTTFITLPFNLLLMIMFGVETSTSQMSIPSDFWNLVILFINICIIAPILEEVLCRGIIIKLTQKYGMVTSLITSTLVFTLLHFEMRTFIPVFFTGLLFGVIRLSTASLIPSVIMHAFNNFISFCCLAIFDEDTVYQVNKLLMCFAVMTPILIYHVFSLGDKLLNYSDITTKKEKTGISVAMIICITMFIVFNMSLFIQRLLDGSCYETYITLFK